MRRFYFPNKKRRNEKQEDERKRLSKLGIIAAGNGEEEERVRRELKFLNFLLKIRIIIITYLSL